MSHSRTLTPICCLLATALLAFAQPAPRRAPRAPLPPDDWEQTPAPPRPAVAPMAPLPPVPPTPVRISADAWDQIPATPAPPAPAVAPVAPTPPVPPAPVRISADAWDQIPATPAPPAPAVAPVAPVPPLPPVQVFSDDFDFQINPDIQLKVEMAREQVEMAREQAEHMKFELQDNFRVKEQMWAAKEMAMADMRSKFNLAFAPQGEHPTPMPAKAFRGMSND